MSIKLKPRTYYKDSYNTEYEEYTIIYTGNKWVYIIADKDKNKLLEKRNKKFNIATIEEWQHIINIYNSKIEEMSKEDVFLELL